MKEAGFKFHDGKIVAPPFVDVEQELQGSYTLAGAHDQVEDPRPIFDQRRSYRSRLHREYLYKRKHQNRDLKVLVVGRDGATGVGKTQLCVTLAKHVDRDWDAEEKATLDAAEYLKMYDEVEEGSALILDEAEIAAPARRSGSNENLDLAHVWAGKRYRGLQSFCSLPTPDMVDKHVRRLADLQITVVDRGLAIVRKLKIKDNPPHEHYTQNVCRLRWEAIDDDKDYQHLHELKESTMSGYSVGDDSEDNDSPTQQDIDAAKRKKRDELIQQMSDSMSQSEIADMLGVSQSTVSRICRN